LATKAKVAVTRDHFRSGSATATGKVGIYCKIGSARETVVGQEQTFEPVIYR